MNLFRQRSARADRLGALLAAVSLAIGLAAPAAALAQTTEWSTVQPAGRDAPGDPPARAGRLSEIEGVAWLLHPASGEWIAAQRNRPVTGGDRLATDAGSRLEWEVGSTAVRLDGATEIEIGRLDDEVIEIHLRAGSVALRIRNPDVANGVSLSSDDGLFSVLRIGSYRLDRREGASRLTVWSGQARYERGEHALTVQQGQSAEFWLDASQRPQYSLATPQLDRFTAWTGELDRAADQSLARRHVSPEMTGADDLDRHGRWSHDPEYGALWTPNEVPPGWAPYATGHWAWVSPWGWSWVDDAPWGFAPFHYGRWIVAGDRWRWAPGRYVARPVYAPALVAWIGSTPRPPHAGGRGGARWIPLAPHEPYLPSHRFSRGYVRDINAPHFHHPRDVERVIQTPHVERGIEYRNRKFHHGTTTIPLHSHDQPRGGPRRGERPFERDAGMAPGVPSGAHAPGTVFHPPRHDGDDRRADRPDREHGHPGERGHGRRAERGEGARAAPGFEPRASDEARRDGGWVRSDRRLERREGDGWRPPAVVSTTPAMQMPQPQIQPPQSPQPPMLRPPMADAAAGGGDLRGERPFERGERPRMERVERPAMPAQPSAAELRAPPPVMQPPPAVPNRPAMQPPAPMPQRPTMRPPEAAQPMPAPSQLPRPVDDTPRNRRDPRMHQ